MAKPKNDIPLTESNTMSPPPFGIHKGVIKKCTIEDEGEREYQNGDKKGEKYNYANYKLEIEFPDVPTTWSSYFTLPYALWDSYGFLNMFRTATKLKEEGMDEKQRKENLELLKDTDTYEGCELYFGVTPQWETKIKPANYRDQLKKSISKCWSKKTDKEDLEKYEKEIMEEVKYAEEKLELYLGSQQIAPNQPGFDNDKSEEDIPF